MQMNSESCVYVEGDDMVYGVQDLNDTSLFAEYSYYGAPQSPTFSGGYFFDNQEQSYEYGTYHYENYPVYYLYPTYPGYYALTNPEFSPENVYNAYYVHVPVYIYYYVPHFVYYLPTSTNNVNDIIYDVDSTQSDESDMMTYSNEQSFDNSQEFNSNFYNIGNISSTDNLDSCNEIVGEGITTCQLFYDEYPQTLNDAPVDDETKRSCINTCDSYSKIVGEEITTGRLFYEVYPAMLNIAGVDDEDKSVSSNENLENNIVSNEPAVNENITVYEESYSIETSHCEDDVDRNLIKKISSMSIDEVKEDIDENYENAKAFVYNEVLKGYIEIKSQLEDLEWECHSLDDIPEEDEEAESESSEMELNENVLKARENINVKKMYLTVVEKKSSFPSEESQTALNEEALGEESRSLSEESQTSSYEDSLVEECGSLSEESQTAENEEALVEEYRSLSEESQTAENEEELVEQCLSLNEESQKAANEESLVEESGSLSEESQTAENDEALVEECLSFSDESQTATNEEALVEQCLSLSEESQTAANEEPLVEERRSLSRESQTASNEGTLVEERRLLSEESQTAENEEALVEENPTLTEESQPSIDSSVVEESQKVDSVPDLILSNNEIDSAYEDPDQNVSSQDLMEERAAAPKSKQRKKRLSRLRKFFGRICCCITKPP